MPGIPKPLLLRRATGAAVQWRAREKRLSPALGVVHQRHIVASGRVIMEPRP